MLYKYMTAIDGSKVFGKKCKTDNTARPEQ